MAPVGSFSDVYTPDGHDELLDADGVVRSEWRSLVDAYEQLGAGELRRRADEIRLLLEQDGVTYHAPAAVRAEGGARSERLPRARPWAVDAVPLVVGPDEWERVTAGVRQRARLLDEVFADLYGERRLVREGLIAPELVFEDPQYLRACDGIWLPSDCQLVTVSADLHRGPDGGWRVLGQRAQAPSGAAYALEARRVVSRAFPRLFRSTGVERLAPYLRSFRAALRAAAPVGVDDPTVVVLSPGPRSETAFEHASIAALLGFPLVQGADLELRDGALQLRTIAGLRRVDVVLRRVDAAFCDPLELRPDSTLGVPGLVEAARTGAVSVVNPLGAGLVENAGLSARLPELCRTLLGEELILDQVESWWCGEEAGRRRVLDGLGSLVVRPVSRAGLENAVDTTRLSRAQLDDLARRIEARPSRWVGQERIEPSTAPVLGDDGLIEPRPTTLRVFVVARGDDYEAMPGGMARSAGDDLDAPITNRAGAVAKDVWVVGGRSEVESDFWLAGADDAVTAGGEMPAARAAEHLFWLGRYLERAEATVRLLRVVNDRRNEIQDAPVGPAAAALSSLLETMTRVTGTFPGFLGIDLGADDPGDALMALVRDGDRPGTVAHAVDRVFDAVEVVRDQLSIDTWLVAGSLATVLADEEPPDDEPLDDERLDDEDASSEAAPVTDDDTAPVGDPDGDPMAILDALLPPLLSFAGLGAESMVRDHAWRFLDAGRRLERAIQVTSLLGWGIESERSPAVESIVIESILTSAESIITYRRRYRSRARVARVLDLLLLDGDNPRAVAFQIDRLARDLSELRVGSDEAPTDAEHGIAAITARLASLDTAALAEADDTGRRAALVDATRSIDADLRAVSDLIGARWFVRTHPQRSVLVPVDTRGRS